MKLHQTGNLFWLLICHKECSQLRDGEGETGMERSIFGVKLEPQKEETAEKPFQYPVLKWKCLWEATASKVHTFLQDAAWDCVNFTCSLYLGQVGCALPLSLVQLLPSLLAKVMCVAFFPIKSSFCCWIRAEQSISEVIWGCEVVFECHKTLTDRIWCVIPVVVH